MKPIYVTLGINVAERTVLVLACTREPDESLGGRRAFVEGFSADDFLQLNVAVPASAMAAQISSWAERNGLSAKSTTQLIRDIGRSLGDMLEGKRC